MTGYGVERVRRVLEIPKGYVFEEKVINHDLKGKVTQFVPESNNGMNEIWTVTVTDSLDSEKVLAEADERTFKDAFESALGMLCQTGTYIAESWRIAHSDIETLAKEYYYDKNPEESAVQERILARLHCDGWTKVYGSKDAVKFMAELIIPKPRKVENISNRY